MKTTFYKEENHMAMYRVWAKMTSYAYLDVDASSKEEAEKIAEEIDGGEFIPTEDGDWEIMDSTDEL